MNTTYTGPFFNPFRGQHYKHPRFTREQIREIARVLGIKRGRNTQDTLDNLKKEGVVL